VKDARSVRGAGSVRDARSVRDSGSVKDARSVRGAESLRDVDSARDESAVSDSPYVERERDRKSSTNKSPNQLRSTYNRRSGRAFSKSTMKAGGDGSASWSYQSARICET